MPRNQRARCCWGCSSSAWRRRPTDFPSKRRRGSASALDSAASTRTSGSSGANVAARRIGVARLLPLLVGCVGAAEQAPAFGLSWIACERNFQLRDRIGHGGWRPHLRVIERSRRSQHAVQPDECEQGEGADRRRRQRRAAPQRSQHDGEHQDREHRGDDGEQDRIRHHHSCASSADTSLPAWRRTTRATTKPPASNSSAGPNHSSHVLPSTRGL